MARFGIGQAVRRVEDERFLKGAGNYVGDIALPGELCGVVAYSSQARARIRRVDASKARAAPGVVLVLTGADAVADKIGALAPAAMPEEPETGGEGEEQGEGEELEAIVQRPSEAEMEKTLAKIDRSATTYRNRVAELLGEQAKIGLEWKRAQQARETR